MKKIGISMVLATISAMSFVANAEELKDDKKTSINKKSEINGIESLSGKKFINIKDIHINFGIEENYTNKDVEDLLNKKIASLKLGEAIDDIVSNYGEEQIAKQEIFELLVLGQAAGAADSTNIGRLLGTMPNQTTNVTNNQGFTGGSSCHFACHGACHSACHGSRGWR